MKNAGLLIGLSALVVPSWHVPAPAAEPREANEVDCGTAALYYLLNIKGQARTLDEVRAALPERDERGYSFRELADSAKSFGLEVTGERSLDLEHAPDRPIIAFIKRPEHGHYVVLRPVGHTGRLVQVLDGRESPEVLDMTAFRAEQGWTGLCLIPEHKRQFGLMALAATTLMVVAWVSGWIWHRRRSTGQRR